MHMTLVSPSVGWIGKNDEVMVCLFKCVRVSRWKDYMALLGRTYIPSLPHSGHTCQYIPWTSPSIYVHALGRYPAEVAFDQGFACTLKH